jgi:hypothetical protein
VSQRSHLIARYHYAIDVSAGAAGRLTLWDATGAKVGDIACLDEPAPLPAPRFAADLSSVAAFVRPSGMPGLLDMLRNERGTALCLDDAPPGFVTFENDTLLIECAAAARPQENQT